MTSSQTVTSHSTTGGDSGHITLSDWRPLGQTGMSVSPLGLGGAYLGAKRNRDSLVIDEELGIATVLRALELGINLIDTSGSYMGNGRSEGLIGKALSAWRAAGGRREGLVLSTKQAPATPLRARKPTQPVQPGRASRSASSCSTLSTWTLRWCTILLI